MTNMKKRVFSLVAAAALVLGVSCKEGSKTADQAKEAMDQVEETSEAVADKVAETTEAVADGAEDMADSVKEGMEDVAGAIPSFDAAEVTDYVASYESYMTDYKKVMESKDMTAMASLSQKGQDLAKKAQELTKNLSAEDSKKLTDYLTTKAKEMQEMMK